jgi:hypothetical protein
MLRRRSRHFDRGAALYKHEPQQFTRIVLVVGYENPHARQ